VKSVKSQARKVASPSTPSLLGIYANNVYDRHSVLIAAK